MKAVYKNFSLGAIEENLRNLIKECEIWSDLDLSYEEYEILSQKIYEVTNGKSNILNMQKSYPLVNITHAVNLVIHEDYEDFWTAYSKKLGTEINSNKQITLGRNWKLILQKFGCDKFSYVYKDVNSMPIICQAGIPSNEIEDIFDIIKYSDMKDNFEPEVLINQLKSWRSYAVGVITKTYIMLYPEKAAKLFIDINELVNLDEGIEIDEERYHARVISKYYEWKEKSKYRGRKRPNNIDVPLPYLIYDQKENQFSLILPPFCVKNEYAHYMKYRIVDTDYNRYDGEVLVRNDGQGRFIDQQVIPVKAAREYTVHWYEDTDEINDILEKKIAGVLGYGYVIYDCEGKRIYDLRYKESNKIESNILKNPIFDNIRYRTDFGKEKNAIIYWNARKSYPAKSFVLKQLNNPIFVEEFDITKCKKLKAASGEKHCVFLKNKLENGIYKIYDAENCDLTNDSYTPEKIDDIHIFKHREEGYKEKVGNLNEILVTTLMNYDSIAMLKKINMLVEQTGEKRDSYLDDKSCEILILLICNYCGKFKPGDDDYNNHLLHNSKICSQMIEEILKNINLHMLNMEQRGIILQKICRYNLSQKEFKLCFEVLSLNISIFRDTREMSVQEIEKLSKINDIVAMRLCLKSGIDYKQRMRLLGFVGIDAMKEMLQFNENTYNSSNWMEAYEEFAKGNVDKTDYRFVLTSKITGNHKEFHDMVNWGVPGRYRAPEIDFDRKESEGTLFCGRLYLDVLLSWYMRYRNKSEEMAGLVKDLTTQIASIDKAYLELNQEIKNLIKIYENSLSARFIEGKSVFATFYYCGLASVMLALQGHIDLDSETVKTCDRFLQKMNQVFPELVERDLLLADMYVKFNIL